MITINIEQPKHGGLLSFSSNIPTYKLTEVKLDINE